MPEPVSTTPKPVTPPPVPLEQHEKQKQASSVEGAQSVADAVRKVADAAVAEIQKRPTAGPQYDFDFIGTPGGTFRIYGTNLGASGTAKLAGRQLNTTWWGTQYVEGALPSDAQSGEVTVDLGDDIVRRGYFRR